MPLRAVRPTLEGCVEKSNLQTYLESLSHLQIRLEQETSLLSCGLCSGWRSTAC